jgi:hypothetical protein
MTGREEKESGLRGLSQGAGGDAGAGADADAEEGGIEDVDG